MGTLSKAFASVGGYIAGNHELIEVLKHSAPGFVFSVGLPPSMAAAALTSLRVIKREPERVARLHKNGKLFLEEARASGLDTGRALGFGMLPIMVGASTRAAKLVHRMYARGINTSLIIYPGVPLNAGRLRFFLTSEFTPDEIRAAVETANEEIKKV
jgi:8-amino-7-oxononanoate synthase